MPSRTRAIVSRTLIAFGLIVIGLGVMIYTMLRLSVPPTSGEVSVVGTSYSVNITYDDMGLPQIWAQSQNDAYFALGYLHASDRLFQMELVRRLSQGRISELLGQAALDADIKQRQAGHYRRAKESVSQLHERDHEKLESYTDGINAYVKACRAMPFEFYLLQIDFEPWTPVDCIALLLFQTWFSDALQNRDMFFIELENRLGRDRALSLIFDYPDWAPTTIGASLEKTPRGDSSSESNNLRGYYDLIDNDAPVFSQIVSETSNSSGRILQSFIDGSLALASTKMSNSSNAFVASPARSVSGQAMLAADPHLEISRLPQFWYFVGLHAQSEGLNVLGITTPGLPFVVMGHNGHAAWAFTAGGIDITEYYEERLNQADSNLYLTPDGWRRMEIIEERFIVAGIDSVVVIRFKSTVHGPVVISKDATNRTLSLRWAGQDSNPVEMVANSFALHSTSNFDQFRRFVTGLGALDANWMYADRNGHIGYQLGTPIPRRPAGTPNLPLPGWTDKFEWDGYLPLESTPSSIDPPAGWLANCNNYSGSIDSIPIPGNYAADRILRMNELLDSQEKFTPEDFHSIQFDRQDSYLMRWQGEMSRLLDLVGETNLASEMSRWDGTTDVSSRPTLLVNMFLSQLIKRTLGDELGDKSTQYRKIWIDRLYHSDITLWYDDVTTGEAVESREDVALAAMRDAVRMADNSKWGERHSLTMTHPLARIPIMGSSMGLRRGPWPWSGTAGTLNASFFRESENGNFRSFVGPSWRFVIDFADINGATFVLPAGNSGNPMSPYFFNFNSMWQSGQRWVVPFELEPVRQRAVSQLLLTPTTSQQSK